MKLSSFDEVVWMIASNLAHHGSQSYSHCVVAVMQAIVEDPVLSDTPPKTANEMARIADAAYDKLYTPSRSKP